MMARSTILAATVVLGAQLIQGQYIDEQVYPSRKYLLPNNNIIICRLSEYSQRDW
jgi:hypothetical protein